MAVVSRRLDHTQKKYLGFIGVVFVLFFVVISIIAIYFQLPEQTCSKLIKTTNSYRELKDSEKKCFNTPKNQKGINKVSAQTQIQYGTLLAERAYKEGKEQIAIKHAEKTLLLISSQAQDDKIFSEDNTRSAYKLINIKNGVYEKN
jgi:hypothetical protein